MPDTTDFRTLLRRASIDLVEPGQKPLTMPQLAIRCGVSRSFLFQLANGQRQASQDSVRSIAAGLGVPLKRVQATLSQSWLQAQL